VAIGNSLFKIYRCIASFLRAHLSQLRAQIDRRHAGKPTLGVADRPPSVPRVNCLSFRSWKRPPEKRGSERTPLCSPGDQPHRALERPKAAPEGKVILRGRKGELHAPSAALERQCCSGNLGKKLRVEAHQSPIGQQHGMRSKPPRGKVQIKPEKVDPDDRDIRIVLEFGPPHRAAQNLTPYDIRPVAVKYRWVSIRDIGGGCGGAFLRFGRASP